jgi:predicted phosphodiesterase
MRYGLLADVHGNLAALQAVLQQLAGASVDRYVVAGDLVGYGPNPNECVEAISGLDPVCVAGNHDLMAIGLLSDERCIPLGQTAMRWTRSVLSANARAYLEALPARAEAPGGVVVAHGSLDDPERYTTNVQEAVDQLAQVERVYSCARILVLGHTHHPLVVGSGSEREQQRQERLALSVGERYVVNPGGVGQARELRCRARFGVLDLDSNTLELEAIRYNVASCRRDLRSAGLSPHSCHLRPSAAGAARRALRSIRWARHASVQRLRSILRG